MPLAAQGSSRVAIYESRRRTWKDAISHQNQVVGPRPMVSLAHHNPPKETECRLLGMHDAQELVRRNANRTGWCSVRAGVFVLCDPLGRNSSGKKWNPGFLSSHVASWGMGRTWFMLCRRLPRHAQYSSRTEEREAGLNEQFENPRRSNSEYPKRRLRLKDAGVKRRRALA